MDRLDQEVTKELQDLLDRQALLEQVDCRVPLVILGHKVMLDSRGLQVQQVRLASRVTLVPLVHTVSLELKDHLEILVLPERPVCQERLALVVIQDRQDLKVKVVCLEQLVSKVCLALLEILVLLGHKVFQDQQEIPVKMVRPVLKV